MASPNPSLAAAAQVRKHIKGSAEYRGTIVSIEAPIHVSNIQLVDPATGCALPPRPAALPPPHRPRRLPTKVGIMYNEEREKVRVARESGNPIAKPEALKERRNIRREPGPRDTTPDDAVEQTFVLAPAGEGESAE